MAACDTYFDNVGVLAFMEGANGGTTFTDESNYALTITPGGDVKTSTANGSPFGAGSAADFGSVSAGFLDIPVTAGGPLYPTADFVFEIFFRLDASSTVDRVLFDWGNYIAGSGFLVEVYKSGSDTFIRAKPGSGLGGWQPVVYTAASLVPGTWYHLAVVRKGTSGGIAINGTFGPITTTWSAYWNPPSKLRLGDTHLGATTSPAPWFGQMSNLRVTKNYSRYKLVDNTQTFNPPTNYYPIGECATVCDPAFDSSVLAQIDGAAFVLQSGGTPTLNIVGSGGGYTTAQALPPVAGSLFSDGLAFASGPQTRYIEISDSVNPGAFDIAANQDFSIEAMIYFPSGQANSFTTIFSGALDLGTTGWWALQVQNNGTLYLLGTAFGFVGSVGLTPDSWVHVALTRTANTVRVYVNGQRQISTTATGALVSQSGGVGRFRIGASVAPAASDNGDAKIYVQMMRFTKGVNRYPDQFVVSPAPVADFVCGVQCDPDFNDVSTLLTMDGTNGSTSFPDDAATPLTWTAQGTAAVDTAVKRFGTGSLNPGTGSIRSPVAGALDISATDFTVEFWAYWNTVGGLTGLLNYGNALASNGFRMYMNGGGLTAQMLLSGWNDPPFAANFVAGQWYHIAISRRGSELRAFMNGLGSNITGAPGAPTMAGNVDIGIMQFGPHDGYIDEFRVTKGSVRYWDSFMPPQQPFGLVCIGTVPVPDVEGLTLADATDDIEDVDLVVGTVTYDFDPVVAAGLVISSDPIAGTDAPIGSAVDLVISLGLEAVVPNIVGLAQADAIAALTTAGLAVGVIGTVYSDLYPVDSVVTQDPVAGTSVGVGSDVSYELSLGPTPIEVPNVVNSSLEDATAIIEGVGLTVGGLSNAYSEDVPAGSVMAQTPLAGSLLLPGAPVSLVISLGPEAVSVPDVVGLTSSAAADVLRAAGLRVGRITVDTSGATPLGLIAAEFPNAGALVPSGTKIALVLSAIAPPFEVGATVISQYAQSPTLVELVESMAEYIDPRVNLTEFYAYVWNVDTATGFGLDVWGKIVGVGRLLRIVADDPIFGFDNASTPPPDWQPFGEGRFARNTGEGGEAVILPDDAYRILILTKALANIASTSSAAINQLLRNLFPGRGKAYVEDLGGMEMRFVFDFALTPVEYAIVSQSGALPHPAGVALSVSVPP